MGSTASLTGPTRSLRVLHISGRSDHGGGPEHILQVMDGGLEGVEHLIACPEQGVYWERFRQRLGAERCFPLPHRRFSWRALWRLWRFARMQDIDLIHSHGTCAGVYGRLLSLALRCPVMHSFHGVPVVPSFKHSVYNLLERGFAPLTRCAVAVSAGEADLVHERWKGYRGKLAVVPNGIEIPRKTTTCALWPTAGAALRIVSFSRNNRQKHPELLIDIARHLHLHGVAFRLDAYGEGLDHPTLAATAARFGLSEVIAFHPPTDQPEAVLATAHLYLSTSRWEGMPLAILEAWRSGLVVVASDVVGNHDLIVDGSNGILFPPGDAIAAARSIHELTNAPRNADRLRQAGAAQVRVQHASSLMALRLGWLYRHLGERTANGLPSTPSYLTPSSVLRTVSHG
jgi:glycosyltransferase involved in cell wall biosynthesis